MFAGAYLVPGTEYTPTGAIITTKLDPQRLGDQNDGGVNFSLF